MGVQFNCPKCGKWLKAPSEHVGKKAKCSGCAAVVTIPAPATSASGSRSSWSHLTPQALRDLPPATKSAAPVEEVEPPVLARRRHIGDDGLDMTPMVDVTFLLLIFFMVTAAYSLQKAIELPQAETKEGASVNRTIEEIEADADYVIVRVDKDSTIWVDEAVAPSEQDLLAKLRAARQGRHSPSGRGPNKMLVMASGDARIEKVVMALDAGTAVGMEDVRLSSAADDL